MRRRPACRRAMRIKRARGVPACASAHPAQILQWIGCAPLCPWARSPLAQCGPATTWTASRPPADACNSSSNVRPSSNQQLGWSGQVSAQQAQRTGRLHADHEALRRSQGRPCSIGASETIGPSMTCESWTRRDMVAHADGVARQHQSVTSWSGAGDCDPYAGVYGSIYQFGRARVTIGDDLRGSAWRPVDGCLSNGESSVSPTSRKRSDDAGRSYLDRRGRQRPAFIAIQDSHR